MDGMTGSPFPDGKVNPAGGHFPDRNEVPSAFEKHV